MRASMKLTLGPRGCSSRGAPREPHGECSDCHVCGSNKPPQAWAARDFFWSLGRGVVAISLRAAVSSRLGFLAKLVHGASDLLNRPLSLSWRSALRIAALRACLPFPGSVLLSDLSRILETLLASLAFFLLVGELLRPIGAPIGAPVETLTGPV